VKKSTITHLTLIGIVTLIAVLATAFTFYQIKPSHAAPPRVGARFTGYTVPTAHAAPNDITNGPDGNFWFVESSANKIGRITPNGRITEFALPASKGKPYTITTGPDRALWFTYSNGIRGGIGRITTRGSLTYFPTTSTPLDITTGPDRALWFTCGQCIGRITTSGRINIFNLRERTSVLPQQIVTGPDGALWFTESMGNAIGRMTTFGRYSKFIVPTRNSFPFAIVSQRGRLWFTEFNTRKIASITTFGRFIEYALPRGVTSPFALADLGNGALAYGTYASADHALPPNYIGRITNNGAINNFAIPGTGPSVSAIASGGPNTVWFTNPGQNKIVKVTIN
jgi:virginiamycin B lyase